MLRVVVFVFGLTSVFAADLLVAQPKGDRRVQSTEVKTVASAETDKTLNKMARSLEEIAKPKFLETASGHFTVLLLGALVGGITTYFFAVWERSRQRKRDRKLVVSLLGDEIVLRWHQLIRKDLVPIFKAFTRQNIRDLYFTQFQTQDLYVFDRCAREISLATSFDDRAVVSHIIYVYILCRDFCEAHATFCQDYRERHAATASAPIEKGSDDAPAGADFDDLKRTWEHMKQTYEKMDSQMLSIFVRIEAEYLNFIKGSQFVQQQPVVDQSEIHRRIERAAKDRRPDINVINHATS